MPLRLGTAMPSLEGATEWINNQPDMEALKGHPVLVHFWAISCHICHENMPQVNRWREEYAPRGLKVIAIHMPRQEEDTDVAHVREDTASLNITEPCAVDNLHAIARAFENEYVPAYFLFTPEGALAGRAAGYNGLQMIEAPLLRLLGCG